MSNFSGLLEPLYTIGGRLIAMCGLVFYYIVCSVYTTVLKSDLIRSI